MNKFEEYFVNDLKEVKKFLKNREEFYERLKEIDFRKRLEELQKIFEYSKIEIEKNFEKCVEKGLKQYNINFHNKILDLIESYKKENNFWTGDKRFPHPLTFNVKDKYSLLFVKKYAQILGRSLSVPIIDDDKEIIKIISEIKLDNYAPKPINSSEKFSNNGKFPKEKDAAIREEIKLTNKKMKNYIKEINSYFDSLYKSINDDLIKIEEFDKDDESKGHVDFLYAFTNLRAENYNIEKCDITKVKMYAGNIVPAIASTTAAIVGIVALQIYVLKTTEDIKYLRDCYFDFERNVINFEFLWKVKYIKEENNYKLIPEKFSDWDYLEVNGPLSIKHFIDYIKQEYNVKVKSIFSNKKVLFDTNEKELDILDLKIEEVYNNKSSIKLPENKKFLFLEILGDIDDCIAKMPKFKYIFK